MTDDHYLNPYREHAKRHGPDWRVSLWASEQSQLLRFDIFTQMCFLAGKRILDAGCGRGDFAHFLIQRDIPFSNYVGVDAISEVIDFATRRHLRNCEFHAADLLHDPAAFRIGAPQIVCMSGTLNTMDDAQVMTVLDNAWSAAEEALMFNFLSDRTGRDAIPQDGYTRRFNTMKLLDWSFGKTWNVCFRQDYFHAGHDATILMRK